MHYPHEREERQQLLSALVENAHTHHLANAISTSLTGLVVCLAAVGQSLLSKSESNISPWIWIISWSTCFFLLALFFFFLPKLLPSTKRKPLWGIKRSFLIKTTLPFIIASFVLGITLAGQSTPHFALAGLTWSIGYAFTLLVISPYHLPYLGRLAMIILTLSLSIAILTLREVPAELGIAAHHWGNITLIASLGLPCLAMGVWNLCIRK